MSRLVVPLQPQGDGDAVSRVLTQQNVPHAETFGALLGLVFSSAVAYIIGKAIALPAPDRVFDRHGADEHAKKPLMKITTLVMAFVALGAGSAFAGLGSILQSPVIIGAAATFVIGFAMQDVIVNLVTGIFIFTDKSLRISDWIEWDNSVGIVENISLRVTRIRIFDNELFIIPNPQLTDGVIKNPVAKGKLRLQVPFGIGCDGDIQQATDIILGKAKNHGGITTTPEPSIRLTELGDSSVTLKLRIWISQPSRADSVKTRGGYVTVVKERFDKEGVDTPYPNRTPSDELLIGGAERFARSSD